MPAILFVCTANQCRSPVAAALLKRRVARLADAASWQVESAGTWAAPDRPAHRQMQSAAQLQGLDLSQHRARAIDALPQLAAFDLILTMERGQQEALQAEHPPLCGRIHLLSALAGAPYDIPDPVGGTPERYLETVREIERLLQAGWPTLLRLLAQPAHSPAL
jgi:protein-tyrosine-phosphatase